MKKLVFVLCAIAVGALFFLTQIPWVELSAQEMLSEQQLEQFRAGHIQPVLLPLAFTTLLALVLVFFVRGLVRRFVGVVVSLLGLTQAVLPWFSLAKPGEYLARPLSAITGVSGGDLSAFTSGLAITVGPLLFTVAGAAIAFCGALITFFFKQGKTLASRKYSAPKTGARRPAQQQALPPQTVPTTPLASPQQTPPSHLHIDQWDALSAGADPTTDPSDPATNHQSSRNP